MYHMEHLLTLLTVEKAKALHFRPGMPPLVVSEYEQRSLQGPSISADEVEELLRGLANSRHMRDLREHGVVRFVYTTRGRTPFLVSAKMENESVVFEVS